MTRLRREWVLVTIVAVGALVRLTWAMHAAHTPAGLHDPGLYIRAEDDIPAPLRNIGIRIEDDVLVTDAGCEVITAEAPKAIADIEALMRDARGRD